MTQEQLEAACSGIGIAAYRKDGKLVGVHNEAIEIGEDWPEEITVFGHTYKFEDAGVGECGFEWAEYA